jgi:hypothetical protein
VPPNEGVKTLAGRRGQVPAQEFRVGASFIVPLAEALQHGRGERGHSPILAEAGVTHYFPLPREPHAYFLRRRGG